jgi:hypothetical protein
MTIIVQAMLDSREETRWLAYMMGSGSELGPLPKAMRL